MVPTWKRKKEKILKSEILVFTRFGSPFALWLNQKQWLDMKSEK
jgi:hypothetical protein